MHNYDYKALFIFPNINTSLSWSPAVQILSAVLKREGYSCELIHIHDEDGFPNDREKIAERVKMANTDIVLITATSFEYDEMNSLVGHLKVANIKCPVVLGGIHATLKPTDIEKSNFDIFCIGEGEIPLLELIKRLRSREDISDIKSLWIKNNGHVIRNSTGEFIKNLESLPFSDWDIMDTSKLLSKRSGWLSIHFSRGCPFNCAFCVNPALRGIKGSKGYFRRISVGRAISELVCLAEKYNIDSLNLDDDLLLIDKKWFKEFGGMYKEKIFSRFKIKYKINARVDSINKEVVGYLKNSECKEVHIGVETGNEKLRNTMLGKKIKKVQIINAMQLLKEHDIKVLTYIMIGIPGEDIKTYNETLELMAETQPDLIRPTFYIPIPCTSLYDYCEKHNLFKEGKKVANHFSDSVLIFDTLTEAELLKIKILFPWYINTKFGHKEYIEAISLFDNDSYEEFKSKFSDIIEIDKMLDKKHAGIPHYSYFNRNLNFLALNA